MRVRIEWDVLTAPQAVPQRRWVVVEADSMDSAREQALRNILPRPGDFRMTVLDGTEPPRPPVERIVVSEEADAVFMAQAATSHSFYSPLERIHNRRKALRAAFKVMLRENLMRSAGDDALKQVVYMDLTGEEWPG